MQKSNEIVHAFRLLPSMDLKKCIQQYVNEHKINAGWIGACVGSLTSYNIRFAKRSEGVSSRGYFEILSLAGTVSVNGSHLHISIADNNGKTIGGHLLDGCEIYTTAEVILVESCKHIFLREIDESTSFKELQIKKI